MTSVQSATNAIVSPTEDVKARSFSDILFFAINKPISPQ